MGIDCDIDSWLTPIPMNRPDIENAIKRAEFTKQREGHRSSRPGTATVRPVSSGRRSRPQTAKSLAGEEKADVENLGRAASRPATAAGRVVVAIGNAYGDARDKAKMANTQPLNRKALQPDVPDEQLNPVFAIFLGQEPWPPSGERKYLRCQAQLHSVHAMYVLLRLAVASLITSLLDHFDRIRKEGATVSFDILTHRLLIQLLPSIGIPLVSIIILALLRHLRLLTWIQPLLLLTFSATASAFLLGPMEILSTITPDAFPQPKISAYVALIVILCAQSCLIVARSFVAWCLAILFLAIGRIPLAFMPYYTAVQMVFLIAMAAQVRAFEALSREAYETMHAVRLGDKALVAGTGRVRKLLKRKGEDDSFFGVRDEFVEEFGRKVVNSRHEVIEVEPFTVQPDEDWEESDDDSYDMETDDVEEIVVTDTSGNSRMALEAMIAEMTAPRETRSRYQTMEKLQALLADESWRKEWVEDGESVQTSDAQQEKPVEHDEVRENTEYMVERHKLSSLSSSIRNLGIAETSRVGNSVMTASLHSINPVQPVTSKDEPSRAIGSTLEKLDISPHLDIKPSDVKEPGHPVHLEQTNFEAIERTIAEPVGDMNNLTRETSEEGARMLVKHGKLAASVKIPNEPVVDPIVEANVLSFETASEVKAKEEQGEKAEETAAIAEILAEVIPKPLTAEEKEEFGSRHVLESKQSVVTIGGKEIAELGTQPMRPSVPLAPVHVPLTSTKSVKSQDALEPTPAPSEIVEPQPGNTITPEESVTRLKNLKSRKNGPSPILHLKSQGQPQRQPNPPFSQSPTQNPFRPALLATFYQATKRIYLTKPKKHHLEVFVEHPTLYQTPVPVVTPRNHQKTLTMFWRPHHPYRLPCFRPQLPFIPGWVGMRWQWMNRRYFQRIHGCSHWDQLGGRWGRRRRDQNMRGWIACQK
ncbi:hypothetical protein BC829DRAFT_398266 [Chytridium lagenaria]|nr:hypothetical protein BC829DRAFT_398266 [Chytridium lagenaria]